MKIRTFVVGCCLALAVFVFGQRRPDPAPTTRVVVELPQAVSASSSAKAQKPATKSKVRRQAPAK